MRLFDEHKKRKTSLLDGIWDFASDEENAGENEQWYKKFPENSIKVAVPSCINNRLGYINFQDVAWYKKDFFASGAITVKFHAVTEYAKVYLDGKYLGDHYGGFTSFEFDTVVESGMHTLVVRVDPRSTEDTIPLWAVDWHHYCGIIRSVEVFEHKTVSIKAMQADYELSDSLTSADLKITATLKNHTAEKIEKSVQIEIDGTTVYNERVTVGDTEEICARVKLDNVRLWDVGKPELYTVTVSTDDDDLTDRIGFRRIEVDGKRILLNKKPIKITGVNRHEEHPEWGFAMPAQLNSKDVDILKDLNVNAVRGSHYPNSHLFVDMCDAEGILFWSEIPMWGFQKESLARELVIKRGLVMHKEMVNQYRNHPSIIIWGMHNEVATDSQEGRAITEQFVNCVKSLDPSRLITYATDKVQRDVCLDLVDFISLNQYVGWYGGEIKDWADSISKTKNRLKEMGVDNKPIVMSEFGTGAIFGNKSFEELRWSENYQVEFYKHTLDLFLNDEDISGVYLWQFSDIRSNPKWSLMRVRGFNNKGLVNEYRQPKLAYYTVKEIFEKQRSKE
ncbi:MAG: beta-glucuronidase [Clostridia bacterium]|nr:beta-glucuronidase [Clostridia bacterium]